MAFWGGGLQHWGLIKVPRLDFHRWDQAIDSCPDGALKRSFEFSQAAACDFFLRESRDVILWTLLSGGSYVFVISNLLSTYDA